MFNRSSSPRVPGMMPQVRAFGRSSGPPPAGISLIANTSEFGIATGGTTSAIDTTSADFLIVSLSLYGGGASGSVSDSKGNTWTPLTAQSDGFSKVQLYYSVPSSVGSGHTFSFVADFATIIVAAFSGLNASPLDVQNGSVGTSPTVQPGSVTPSQSDSLVLSGINFNGLGSSVTIDQSFTIIDQAIQNGNFGDALAYIVETSIVSKNPTWTHSGSSGLATSIAVFKPV